MGVMTCHRGDCENIMCRRYAPGLGYICEGCFEELVIRGAGTNIKEFMATDTPRGLVSDADRAYFEAIFQLDKDCA